MTAAVVSANIVTDAIDAAFTAIGGKLSGIWTGMWAPISDNWPLWWSYGVFGLIVLGALVAAIFIKLLLPPEWSKWPLLIIFFALIAAVAWLCGRKTMFNEMMAKIAAIQAKAKAPKSKPKPKTDGWANPPFGG